MGRVELGLWFIITTLCIAITLKVITHPESPQEYCQKQCNGYLNTNIKIGNTTNIYSCSCDNE